MPRKVDAKIGLFVDHHENSRLLEGLLKDRYAHVLQLSRDDLYRDNIDLLIVDGTALNRHWETINQLKDRNDPLFLPLLLMTARQDLKFISHQMWKTVDELILTPIEKRELQARLEVLLRARRLSLEMHGRYQRLFDNVPNGLFRLTAEGRVIDVNAAFLKLTGFENKEELTAMHFADFFPQPAIADKLSQMTARAQDVHGLEGQLISKNGSELWVRIDAGRVTNRAGQLLYYEGSVVDITEKFQYRRNLESQVEQRTAELQSANNELEAFAYSVSHDLRAPLRAIQGFTQVLLDDHLEQLDEEAQRLGHLIIGSSERMGQLIDALLAFSRLGRAAMGQSDLDMKQLVADVYEELTTEEQRARIKFKIGSLPRARADFRMIRQVWMNLLSNAIKFTRKKEQPLISVSGKKKKNELLYTIRDNGAGFDMAYKDKLFGVFKRLHNEKEFEGNGAGLALVQRIVQRHGGRIWAEGVVDRGATFYFTLPE